MTAVSCNARGSRTAEEGRRRADTDDETMNVPEHTGGMHVLITGGTGFIGAHSVAAVLAAGHRVRLLVRNPAWVERALPPLAVEPGSIEVVTGDTTRRADVEDAVAGCDAVLHAAGLYSFDSRAAAGMAAGNVHATDVVLAAARAARLDPIVHVSTFGALLPAVAGRLSTGSPPGRPREAYLASKAQAEAIARRHQQDGAPVVITYPLASLGPGDPRLGDQLRRVRDVLRGLMPLWPDGGFPVGDVRDVARLHAAVLQPGLGPRRYVAPGRYVSTRDFLDQLRAATGRALPAVHLPARLLLPAGALAGLAQRVTPVALPVSYGAIYLCRHAVPIDNHETAALLGDTGVPLEETMAATVRWLAGAGLISRRQAGHAFPAGAGR
jgi:dihydroflavonol-4-reductase